MPRRVMPRLGVVLLLLAVLGGHATGAAPAASLPGASDGVAGAPGATSLGDPFYPTLGNGGYDVQALRPRPDLAHARCGASGRLGDGCRDHRPAHGAGPVGAVVRPDRSNTQVGRCRSMASRRIDSPGRRRPQAHRDPRRGAPRWCPRAQSRFDWTATPTWRAPAGGGAAARAARAPSNADGARAVARGFLSDGDGGFFMASQPNGAHTLFPSNDYPTDKAPVTVHLTAPPGMLGVATGTTGERRPPMTTARPPRPGESIHPVATHVLGHGCRSLERARGRPACGAAPPFVGTRRAATAGAAADRRLADVVSWLEGAIGRPYPFASLGVQLVAPGSTEAVLEGQTLILADAGVLDPRVDRLRLAGPGRA